VFCGEANPLSLSNANRSLLDEHHLAGEVNDRSLVVVVCRNCHAVLSETQRDSGVDLRRHDQRTSLERLEAVLRGLADFFEQLAASLRRWADDLARSIALLDRDHSDWRNPK
jgi:hypothetical protein